MRLYKIMLPLCLGISPVWADDLTCPRSIEVSPQDLAKPIAGWRSFFDAVNTRYAWESVAIYSGPPEELASLVPDDDTEEYSEWQLTDNGTEHYFITCGYTHTSVQLTRELSPSFTRCRIAYEKDLHNIYGAPSPLRVTCD